MSAKVQKPRLVFSKRIGLPPYVLDPEDLKDCHDLCPDKMGARIRLIDKDTVVKYGQSVMLAEAEALHLVQLATTIQAPKVEAAYMLDGIGYIIMTYEEGEPFNHFWDNASQDDRDNVIGQLKNYVSQLRTIPGDFIGGLDRARCRDGIFAAHWGIERHEYGPYTSEVEFNEGIVRALEDRLPPDQRTRDPESRSYNYELTLKDTVRALKGHNIVFTHGDLHSGNILVRNDKTVVLLDWGLAGFWPEYWEFYRAMFHAPWRASFEREIPKFVPPYYLENLVLQKVFNFLWS